MRVSAGYTIKMADFELLSKTSYFVFQALQLLQLSIIIVNYNVKHFLEQCLYSVDRSLNGIEAEVIIVDNNSSDNSLEYLKPKFPQFRFIENQENLGFGKACNQGLQLSSGKYVLFLNPDTILPEDCLSKCLDYLDINPTAGALGIRMIDGTGQFLRESKRSFPSPVTSLYKLFGLARLFPHSKIFSRYHLGHLSENQNHEVDVLAGAFMMVRKSVLDLTGGFDEVFFMYGEDVDLSYRIQEKGYRNVYFAESSIIHFKGESTKRGSMNYVRMFYNAMSIFVRKHYGGSKANIFNILIHGAIWFRAGMTAFGNFIRKLGLPIIDALFILLSFWLMKNIWNEFVKTDTQYENRLIWIAFPVFTIVYLIVAYYAGLYDRWYKRSELVRSTMIATIVLLAGYALLPEQYRFSRAIILFGALLAFILISVLRWMLVETEVLSSNREKEEHANTLIVASEKEYQEVTQLMTDAGLSEKVLGRVSIREGESSAIGHWSGLHQLIKEFSFREVIFCKGDLSFKNIVEYIPQLKGKVKLKIHTAKSGSIVGSDSRYTVGEAVSKENGFKLSDPYYRRQKRLLDVSFAVLSLLIFPVQLFLVKKPFSFFKNCFSVILAHKTWVGYIQEGKNLPVLYPGILTCNGLPRAARQELPYQSLQMMNYWYARDYEPVTDIKLVWKAYRKLGD